MILGPVSKQSKNLPHHTKQAHNRRYYRYACSLRSLCSLQRAQLSLSLARSSLCVGKQKTRLFDVSDEHSSENNCNTSHAMLL